MTGAMTLLGPDPVPEWPPPCAPTERGVDLRQAEHTLRLRLALTRARDALERHRDPLVAELDEVLAG